MYIGNTPFQGLVGGGNILDASIEGVDLSTSAIAARLGFTPVDPGAAVFTAAPTISSGTANGIAYLNGSKVVTSSSALTYDGTNLTLTTNGSFKSGSAGTGLVLSKMNVGPVNAIRSVANTSDVLLINDSATGFANTAFYASGSEGMRLTPTGFGVGTATPTNGKLEVQTQATTAALWVQTSGTTSSYTIADFRTGTNNSALAIHGNSKLVSNGVTVFYTSGSCSGIDAFNIDIPVPGDTLEAGVVYHVAAGFSHANISGYGCLLDTWYSARGDGSQFSEQFDNKNISNSRGGSWSVSKNGTGTLRVTKNAGGYNGGGPYWIRVTFAT